MEYDQNSQNYAATTSNGNNILVKDLAFIQKQTNNFQVAVRVRPLSMKEISISDFETIRCLDNNILVLLDPQYEMSGDDPLRNNRNREKQYAFDFVFGKLSTQDEIFRSIGMMLVDGCLKGYNATVFAYGSTGAGKTHTMTGSQETPGLMAQMINYLYKHMKDSPATNIVIKVSYIEVYNEVIRDLLTSEDTQIDIREDPIKGVSISGVSEIIADNYNEVMAMLRVGNKNRTKEPTQANEVSSRSHAVFQISIDVTSKNGLEDELCSAKMSLIDLAGSERAAFTGNKGLRLKEGANINKSLLALGNCINALSEGNEKNKGNYIPYRDSKLTRLLKDSLGGNCKTVMIANVSPSVQCYEDTLNTLKYANRAKHIKTEAIRNVNNVSNHIANYTNIINNLKKENDELKNMISNNKPRGGISNNNNINAGYQEKVDSIEREIIKHFQEENEVLLKLLVNEENLENLNNAKGNIDDSIRLSKQKFLKILHDLKEKQGQLLQTRNNIQSSINTSGLNDFSMQYLNILLTKEQLKLEKIEEAHQMKRIGSQIKNKDILMKFLKDQIKVRDEIMKEQKYLLDSNKIKTSVKHERLKSVEQIDQDGSLNSLVSLPKLKKNNFNKESFSSLPINTPGRFNLKYESNKNTLQSPQKNNSNKLSILQKINMKNSGKQVKKISYMQPRERSNARSSSKSTRGILKDSGERGLTYGRRLQKMIVKQNRSFSKESTKLKTSIDIMSNYSGGSGKRGSGSKKKKIGFISRLKKDKRNAYIKKDLMQLNPKNSPYVQDFIKNDLRLLNPGLTKNIKNDMAGNNIPSVEALKMIKRKMIQ